MVLNLQSCVKSIENSMITRQMSWVPSDVLKPVVRVFPLLGATLFPGALGELCVQDS